MTLQRSCVMEESAATRPSLIARIRDLRDEEAWRQFVALYTPLVYRFARSRGLQDADAADLAQDVLRAVANAAAHMEYDPQRGSFRGWLYGVARHKLADFRAKLRRGLSAGTDPAAQVVLLEQPAPGEESSWDQEYEQRLFEWAAEQVRGGFKDQTWQAFWQTAVLGREARETAVDLGMTLGAVYIAKSRVLARLRKQIQEVQGA
jgi:RNA polymerase sigma factor (sigma-70 family)